MVTTLRTLFPYLIRYRWRYVAGMSALVVKCVLAIAIPLAIRFSIDHVLAEFSLQTLLTWVGVLLGLGLAKSLFQYAKHRIMIGISREIEYDLRSDLFRHLLRLSQRFYRSYQTGDLMSRATNDMEAVRLLVGPGVLYSIEFVCMFAAGLAVMSATDWQLTCLVFLPIPFISLTVSFFGRRIHDRFQAVQSKFSELSSAVQENLANVRIVRAFAQQQAGVDHFRELNGEYVQDNLKLIGLWARFYPILEVLIGLTYVIVLWYGGQRVLSGDITLGSFVMFLTYMNLLTWPMVGFGWVVNIVQRGTASLARLNELLHQKPDVVGPGTADEMVTDIRGDLEFRNVTYTYPGASRPALENINVYVPACETLAIIGPTGSGKTTLVNLVARLMDPQSGQVFIDGTDARELPLDVLRRAVGCVPQDTFLFSRPIQENIAFGSPHAKDWEVTEVAEVAVIDADIAEFPEQYETPVGEKGVTLSGGQRQRVAIARALLADPRILILDDAASSVDAHTEEQILQNLQVVMRNRTTLLISHRVAAARLANRIVVVADGRVVESGTHEELLALGGHYYDLHQKHLLEEELEHA
jgi:ATP-binding cassette subfamily B protein